MSDEKDTVKAWSLFLHASTAKTDEAIFYLLGHNQTAADKVREELAAAVPGQFVPVQIRMANMIEDTTLYVQPHAWGAWAVYEREYTTAQYFGVAGTDTR